MPFLTSFFFVCATLKDFLNAFVFYTFHFLVQSSRGCFGSEAFLPLLRDTYKADEMVSLQTKVLQGDQSQAESLCPMLMMREKNHIRKAAAALLILGI